MAYINKKDFSIVYKITNPDYEDKYFECDDLIAPAISLLNMKGYKTSFCCAGHPFPTLDVSFNSNDKAALKELIQEYDVIELLKIGQANINEELLSYAYDDRYKYCVTFINDYPELFYVAFDQNYHFEDDFLPKDFYWDDRGTLYCIRQADENLEKLQELTENNFKGMEFIYNLNKKFYEWVEKLKDISVRNPDPDRLDVLIVNENRKEEE